MAGPIVSSASPATKNVARYAFVDDYDRPSTSSLALDDDLLFGVRAGYWFTPKWSAEGSWQRVSTQTGSGIDTDLGAYRVSFLANFSEGESFRPFVTVGLGDERLKVVGLPTSGTTSWNAGGGFRWQVMDGMAVRGDFRYVWADHGVVVVGEQENIETTLGLSWTFGGSGGLDSDGDGVGGRKDKCPDTPRGATVDAKGCPSDSDGDGVFDGIDRCPDTPKGDKVDASGCSMDSDGDGVNDGPDACPGTPKGAIVDAKGCPKDTDGAHFVSRGVAASRLEAKDYGESQPIASNDNDAGRAKNRRVELKRLN